MGSKPYPPRNDQAGPPVMAVHLEKTGEGGERDDGLVDTPYLSAFESLEKTVRVTPF